MSNTQPHVYNPADPHGFHEGEGHHGHVIVPWQILIGVLMALFFFTALTVFQSPPEAGVTISSSARPPSLPPWMPQGDIFWRSDM